MLWSSRRPAQREMGFTAIKMTPFPIGWPEKRYPNLIREYTGIVAAIHETVGWNVDIGL